LLRRDVLPAKRNLGGHPAIDSGGSCARTPSDFGTNVRACKSAERFWQKIVHCSRWRRQSPPSSPNVKASGVVSPRNCGVICVERGITRKGTQWIRWLWNLPVRPPMIPKPPRGHRPGTSCTFNSRARRGARLQGRPLFSPRRGPTLGPASRPGHIFGLSTKRLCQPHGAGQRCGGGSSPSVLEVRQNWRHEWWRSMWIGPSTPPQESGAGKRSCPSVSPRADLQPKRARSKLR